MRVKRLATAVGVGLLVIGVASPALAASSINPTVVSNTASQSVITVTSTGLSMAGGTIVNYQQCWRDGNAPGFNQLIDCSQFTASNATIVGGNATKNFTVFNGDEPNLGEWGCGPLATAPITSQTCYIRVVANDINDVNNDEFLPFTYGPVTPPDVPEVPLNVLLPASAAAVLGAGFLIARKRHNANAHS
jgi:hypothetical protein